MTLFLGLVVIAAAVVAVVRRVDVRLALGLAAVVLGLLAGRPEIVLQVFLRTLANEQFVVPICTAMGFSHVLRHTGCDRHLVRLLVVPVRRVRPLLVPATVLVGFAVNVPIISQTGTAAAVGPVFVPLLRAAGVSPLTAGSALLLGSSVGGELLNPGAVEYQSVRFALAAKGHPVEPQECVRRTRGPLAVQLLVSTAVFWALSAWAERRKTPDPVTAPPEEPPQDKEPCRINVFKAAVPLVPLLLLFLTGPPLNLVAVPREWLVGPEEPATLRADSRLIGAAMLIGVGVAALAAPRQGRGVAAAFFDGAGYAYAHIISLIVAANGFGKGVELIGLDRLLGRATAAAPALLVPIAVAVPLAFAFVCGSGYAATASLFGFFLDPALEAGTDPGALGALVPLAAAAGRTMSPVAAVVLLCGRLTDTEPAALARRVAVPLVVGLLAVLLVHALTPW
jgi:C4-dicarboxylate transporter, DcuC family